MCFSCLENYIICISLLSIHFQIMNIRIVMSVPTMEKEIWIRAHQEKVVLRMPTRIQSHADGERRSRRSSCWSWRESFTPKSIWAWRNEVKSRPLWSWVKFRWVFSKKSSYAYNFWGQRERFEYDKNDLFSENSTFFWEQNYTKDW